MLADRQNKLRKALWWLLGVGICAYTSIPVYAYAPKALGVVTLTVSPVESVGGTVDQAPLQLTVEVHSQIALPAIRLIANPASGLILSGGQQQWQGAVAAGETLRFSYSLQPGSGALQGKICQFTLLRLDAGAEHWLSGADYSISQPQSALTATRVPDHNNTTSSSSMQIQSGVANKQRYYIEYSLD